MKFQALRDFLDSYIPMLGIPGSDTVIYQNHEQIFRHSSGYDNIRYRTPVRRDALYNIYSCTKISTAVAATQLIERGEILITDPVYAYIPEFADITVAVRDDNGARVVRPAKQTMLIKHLLTMTSGLDYTLNRPAIRSLFEESGGRCPTVEVAKALAKDPLCFEPGSNYRYSLSLDVMGAIIEIVSGMKLGEYMKTNIFDPLGMKETSFQLDDARRARMATHYDYDAESRRPVEVPVDRVPYKFGSEYESAGAGLISSVDDYALLADALACGGVGKSGERILSEAGLRLMTSNALTADMLREFGTKQCSGYGYGFGVRTNMDPVAAGNLAPVGQFGWDGAKLCLLECDPKNKLSVFHAEHMGAFHGVVIPRLRNIIASCID